MADDVRDWGFRLTPGEKNLLTQIFRFFTQSDVEVNENYNKRLLQVIKPVEVQMMLTAFSNMETVHIASYAHLLDQIGMPEAEFGAFLDYQAMKDKHDYLANFNVGTPYETARTIAAFGAFVEGLQLFASFAMLMNFPRFNKMKGMGQIVTWSVRDETLHANSLIRLYHSWVAEHPEIDKPALNQDLLTIAKTVRNHEHAFVDLAFELGDVQGMTRQQVKDYIDFVANFRCGQLGLEKPYPEVTENPLSWLDTLLTGHEHVNFFEARATEYTKAGTQGDWGEVYK
jgi:ribonucleoside-diphosphate reductase beta chain